MNFQITDGKEIALNIIGNYENGYDASVGQFYNSDFLIERIEHNGEANKEAAIRLLHVEECFYELEMFQEWDDLILSISPEEIEPKYNEDYSDLY